MGLMIWDEVAPIEVVLDSSIWIVVTEVQFERGGILEGWRKACWNATNIEWPRRWFVS